MFAAADPRLPVWTWACRRYVAAQKVRPKTGYWVFTAGTGRGRDEPCAVTVTGEPVVDVVEHLQAGWNLVGPVADCPRPEASAITGMIWNWNSELQTYQTLEQGQPLKQGCGYWIYATGPCDANLGESTTP